MHVELTPEETSALRQAVESYCSELRMEIVDTDNPGFRRGLRHERALLESILSKLDEGVTSSDERDAEGRVVVRMLSVWSL
jgi:hypothetical protein